MGRHTVRAGNIGEEEEEQIELIPDRELDPHKAPVREPSTAPAPATPVPVPA